jgi:hypothetical protein
MQGRIGSKGVACETGWPVSSFLYGDRFPAAVFDLGYVDAIGAFMMCRIKKVSGAEEIRPAAHRPQVGSMPRGSGIKRYAARTGNVQRGKGSLRKISSRREPEKISRGCRP